MNNNLFFIECTHQLNLGTLCGNAQQLQGGLTHSMFSITTDLGCYCIKLLNPNIMKRPTAMNNYREAEKLELILENNSIPIIPALLFNHQKMQEIQGQYFYVFKQYSGTVLKHTKIHAMHCRKIGQALASIHLIDQHPAPNSMSEIRIDWNTYIQLASIQCPEVAQLLLKHQSILIDLQNSHNKALDKLPPIASICHNDLDCKNVLWDHDDFKIIDLECLSYANPLLEFFELALVWSGLEQHKIDYDLFKAFTHAYLSNNPLSAIDWKVIIDCNVQRLHWLQFNVKRSLLIDTVSLEEQKLGFQQVFETVELLLFYAKQKEIYLQLFNKAGSL